jgi:hypothetical protein
MLLHEIIIEKLNIAKNYLNSIDCVYIYIFKSLQKKAFNKKYSSLSLSLSLSYIVFEDIFIKEN